MSDENGEIKLPKMKTEFKVISLDLLDDPAKPMRADLSPESVEDLVISIKQVGIIEPLVVKPLKDRYEVVAGHRRLVAAEIVGLAVVPCYIVEADSQLSEVLKIHENIFRRDINPIDEAQFYDWLIQKHKLTPTKVASMISKSHSYVTDRLQILEYPEELKEALKRGQIKFSVAREFNKVSDPNEMKKYLYYAIRSGITPSLAAQWVSDWKRQHTEPTLALQPAIDIPTSQEEYIVKVNCIFCREEMRMFDGEVVYIHPKCHDEVLKPSPNPEPDPKLH